MFGVIGYPILFFSDTQDIIFLILLNEHLTMSFANQWTPCASNCKNALDSQTFKHELPAECATINFLQAVRCESAGWFNLTTHVAGLNFSDPMCRSLETRRLCEKLYPRCDNSDLASAFCSVIRSSCNDDHGCLSETQLLLQSAKVNMSTLFVIVIALVLSVLIMRNVYRAKHLFCWVASFTVIVLLSDEVKIMLAMPLACMVHVVGAWQTDRTIPLFYHLASYTAMLVCSAMLFTSTYTVRFSATIPDISEEAGVTLCIGGMLVICILLACFSINSYYSPVQNFTRRNYCVVLAVTFMLLGVSAITFYMSMMLALVSWWQVIIITCVITIGLWAVCRSFTCSFVGVRQLQSYVNSFSDIGRQLRTQNSIASKISTTRPQKLLTRVKDVSPMLISLPSAIMLYAALGAMLVANRTAQRSTDMSFEELAMYIYCALLWLLPLLLLRADLLQIVAGDDMQSIEECLQREILNNTDGLKRPGIFTSSDMGEQARESANPKQKYQKFEAFGNSDYDGEKHQLQKVLIPKDQVLMVEVSQRDRCRRASKEDTAVETSPLKATPDEVTLQDFVDDIGLDAIEADPDDVVVEEVPLTAGEEKQK